MLTKKQIAIAKRTKLSKNFTLWECIESENYPKLVVFPSKKIIERLRLGCQMVLQPLRDRIKKPVYLNSGYRNLRLNRAVGGSKLSCHLLGTAYDIKGTNLTDDQYKSKVLYFYRFELKIYRQLIQYDTFVHVSYNIPGRKYKNQQLDKRK